MFTIEKLHRHQESGIPSFFPTLTRRAWQPASDKVADKFFHISIAASGAVVLHDIIDANNMLGNPKLNAEELSPRSVYTPDMIRKQCESWERGGVMGKYDSSSLKLAFEKVRRMFRLDHLKPLALEEVPYQSSSNAGLPTLTSKADDYPRAFREARRMQANQKIAPQPTVMAHRGKNEDEARFVEIGPFSHTLIEGRFFYPYQRALMLHHTPYAGGRYDYETAGLLNEIRVKSRFVVEFDYSKYDSSISAKLISMAFAIIRDSFEMGEQDELDWDRVTRYFLTGPRLAPDGYIYYGRRHGVPSGSDFTQVIDSIVNCILLEYVQRRMKFKLIRYLVLGDDVVGGVDKPIDLAAVAETLAELGIKLNVEKSRVIPSTQEPHFLGHYERNMTMIRPVSETLERLATPERPKKEFYSKDRDTRRKAFVQRIRDYQMDNPDAHKELEALACFYQMVPWLRKKMVREYHETGSWPYRLMQFVYLNQWHSSDDRIENERARWDPSKRDIARGTHRGMCAFI